MERVFSHDDAVQRNPPSPMKSRLLFSLLLLLVLAAAQAQVPGLVNYQGRISVGFTNFTGTGQFKFALTNGGGSTFLLDQL
jgi:hypothetical protein